MFPDTKNVSRTSPQNTYSPSSHHSCYSSSDSHDSDASSTRGMSPWGDSRYPHLLHSPSRSYPVKEEAEEEENLPVLAMHFEQDSAEPYYLFNQLEEDNSDLALEAAQVKRKNPPDQHLLTLQSILECILHLETADQRIDMLGRRLDMLDHGVREAMQEIRCIKNPICSYQSYFTMEHLGGCDSTVDSQAGVNNANATTSLGSSHDGQIMLQPAAFHGTSSGVIRSLSARTTDLLPHGAHSSPITVKHLGGRDRIINSQAGLNSLNAIQPSISWYDLYLMLQPAAHEVLYRVTRSVQEGTESLLLNGTHDFANNVTQQHSIYSEGFPVSYVMDVTESSSEGMGAHFDLLLDVNGTSDPVCEPAAQQLGSVVQTGRVKIKVGHPKVKCPWDKCPKFINKDGLSRHINEVHEKKIVAVCPRCDKFFTCTNVMMHHVCRMSL
ncbi:uncharacterized protein F5147DRAFT_779541 [Suillus discolor]|uniref:Uncharacterized protein n=1 Tax=Suillus discolor TaxID=1912936 RepID=A0A9P7JN58_9AGAM|nr:uncharacterized protein F5147DRAFT_779541 [Suillus discolor]KAG2092798.1 hypothetical protein F5147DRAFT_779541 [Suillus discolor]